MTRAEEAQRLVDEGNVDIAPMAEYGVVAKVASDSQVYLAAILPSGRFWCTCKWGQTHSYTDDLCAHALAVRLVMETEASQTKDPYQTLDKLDRMC